MVIELPAPPTVKLRVRHANVYEYDHPIERSVHRLHLHPIHDRWQSLVTHQLQIDPSVDPVEFEDVFGNSTTWFELGEPYSKLSLVAESTVELRDVDPIAFAKLPVRPKIPVNWMPFERMMLSSYLTPDELPETQLDEIFAYAQSFAARNDNDLWETLFDMNLTLFREFAYVPASTHLETTPFEVFSSKGVCQDFANLMICMAQMLNIPARYVCGYVLTTSTGDERPRSEASHAWVQLYLPQVGWKGFDPTNGVLPSTQHVRMAVGRHYRDTAPVTGTLYTPAAERLSIDVKVEQLE